MILHAFALFFFANHAQAIERPPLVLGVGEQRIVRVPGLARYSLGSAVVKAHPLGKSLDEKEARESILLRGVTPGTGDLWVWKKDGTSESRAIRVERTIADELPGPLLRALSRLRSCEVFFHGQGVVVRGFVEDADEAGRVAAIARGFPREVRDETEIAEELLAAARTKLESALRELKLAASIRVERIGSALWARGSLDRQADRPAVERKLRAAYPAVDLELDTMADSGPTVHFKVFLLELRKNRLGHFGLTWPALQEGAFRVTSGKIQDLVQLDVALQALEGEGAVRVLSNPELVVRAPGEAQLFAGGELPISMRSAYYQNVSWKNYGLMLKLKVTDTTSEKVRLDVFTEVSRLDPAIAMGEVPGLQTNRMNTAVDARYGVPLFLSGLLQEGTRESARGLPGLRRIPILGSLFGSEDYLNERSELVAILLPSLEPPAAPMHRMTSREEAGVASLPEPDDETPPEPESLDAASARFPWRRMR
ncbi:MAG TPA: type II and III secretion system protein [Bdellovibrionota bacterium]|nr:type II and III secretion system protein [Bdellovibrionota bacterium]